MLNELRRLFQLCTIYRAQNVSDFACPKITHLVWKRAGPRRFVSSGSAWAIVLIAYYTRRCWKAAWSIGL